MQRNLQLPLILLLICSFQYLAFTQENKVRVPFLKQAPVIDGMFDKDLFPNPIVFPHVERSSEDNPINQAYYQFAYGTDFLYVFVRYFALQVETRDRAYQHGDGLLLMIGNSKTGSEPTEEYMVLGFSASTGWDGKFQWYFNKELTMKRFGEEVKVMTGHHGYYAEMEVLIPWQSMYPFNPFLQPVPLAMNLCFTDAIGEKEKNTFFLVKDELMQSEDAPRKYLLPEFSPAEPSDDPDFFMVLQQSTVLPVDPVVFALYSFYRKADTLLLRTTVYSGENTVAFYQVDTLKTGPDKNILYQKTRSNFPVGGYRLHIDITSGGKTVFREDQYFSVLPELIPSDLRVYIDKLKPRLVPGTYNTLMFHIQDYETQLRKLKPYQTCYDLRLQANRITYLIDRMEKGDEIVSRQKGLMRRAYFCSVDSTYQPYSLFVPRYYERDAYRYPLVVYLHGSGEDDRSLSSFLGTATGDFMVLAPKGRGNSNCFATPEALRDVRMAIADVVSNYSIDTTRIILAGFSMGGYGAMRVFYEYPKLFSGAALLSANPNLAAEWLGGKHPDFTDPKYLGVFKGKEVFVYHGQKDMNAPYRKMADAVAKMEKAGAKVRFVTEESGHDAMNEESRFHFVMWLRKMSGYEDKK
ncbi:MAG TPA: alpha/beta hydrolase-fold protein [Bacteroidales bacterium]|nr:alpha/beta hydrolase-fold protein [Bacteroidales bacterium]HSA44889.1 alpha/beta hydrolase-fold protein [Bacteroidales bacterium]